MEKISEKDLYVFVFSPEHLPNSKLEEISENKESFKSQLDQLLKMKDYLASLDSGQIPVKIFRKIKEIEEGSDILEKKLLSGKRMEYFIHASKSSKKSKKILS